MKHSWKSGLLLGAWFAFAGSPAPAQQPPTPSTIPGGLGLVPTPAKQYGLYPHLAAARDLDPDQPKQLILDKHLPPIANQGHTSSCVGWSTAYYCYSYAVASERQETPDELLMPKFQFSPAFIWHQGNQGDKEKGMTINQAFDILATQGCASLQEDPWDENDATSEPSAAAKARAARFKARKTAYLFKGARQGDPFNPEKMRTLLYRLQLPIVMGIDVFDDFGPVPHDPDFVYSPHSDKLLGGHAITIIGYDADKKAFRMVNSWGPDWADHGFLWLSEDYLVEHAHDGFAQIPGGPVARDITGSHFKSHPGLVLEPPAAQAVKKKPAARNIKL